MNRLILGKNKAVESKFFTLWYNIFGNWIKSNWTKVVKYIDNKIFKVTATYRRWCWSCHHPIESSEVEYKISGMFPKKVSGMFPKKVVGNERCSHCCKYFICKYCHKCLCHPGSPVYVIRNGTEVSTKWIEKIKQIKTDSGKKLKIR